ncbi:hypothetical protein ACDY96_19970 [Rhizobium mongolense]|uniref:hypothetical protein n=1 Tax=Rhizobium mongolense TaxID=57676 RepID=UPI0035590EC1
MAPREINMSSLHHVHAMGKKVSADPPPAKTCSPSFLILGCDPNADFTHLILNSEVQDAVLHLKQGSVENSKLESVPRKLPLELQSTSGGNDERTRWPLY